MECTPLLALLLCTLLPLTCAASVSTQYLAIPDGFMLTRMNLRDVRLSAGFCCERSCFCHDISNSTSEQCGAIEARLALLSPSLCASASQNSSSTRCPLSSTAILCDGGPGCCADSCNESCTSKLDVCACPCEHCSACSCCKRVANRHCWLQCNPCKKVWMMLDFEDGNGNPHLVNTSYNFSPDSVRAHHFYSIYKGMPSILGFFKRDDPNIVDVSEMYMASLMDTPEQYPVQSHWASTLGTYGAFPIFTVSVLLMGLLVALLLQRTCRGDRRPFRIAWSVNRGLWIGIIWPLIILLLILQVCRPRQDSDTVLCIFVPQMLACIGWLPIILLWLYHIVHPSY